MAQTQNFILHYAMCHYFVITKLFSVKMSTSDCYSFTKACLIALYWV